MDRLRAARRQPRRVVTITVNEVDAELSKNHPCRILLTDKKARLEEIRDQLVALDQNVLDQMLDDNAPIEEQDNEHDAILEYQSRIRMAIIKIDSKLSSQNSPNSPNGSMHSAYSSIRDNGQTHRNFKLPKIELQTFNGDLKEWLGFWSQFEKIHSDDTLHDSDKFQYLKQAMKIGTEAWELINSYPASAANYSLAVGALKERFGRENLLLQVYIRELLQLVIVNVTQKDKMPLDRMYIKLESHLRSLSSLNLATADPSTWLFPLVESSLPVETLRVWQRSALSKRDGSTENPPKTCLDFLMEFLKGEVQSEQQISLAQNGFQHRTTKSNSEKRAFPPRREMRRQEEEPATVAGLHVGEKSSCLFCDKPHESDRCGKAKFMTLEDKTQEIKKKKACFICLRKGGHGGKPCRAFVTCVICDKRHYCIICPDLPRHQKRSKKADKADPSPTDDNGQQVSVNFSASNTVLLGTFRTTIVNGKNKLQVRALYDPGAQRSYVSKRVAEELNLHPVGEERISHSLFGGVQTEARLLKSYNIQLMNSGRKGVTNLSVLEKDKICGNIPRLVPGPWLKELKKKNIWISDMASDDNYEVDLLVGADIYGKLLTGRIHQINNGITAIETTLGWVVLGCMNTPGEKDSNLAMTVINMFVAEDASLEQLWTLEAIGIKDVGEHKAKAEREAETKQHFARTVTRNKDGRYCVRLPWMDGDKKIPSNRKIAEARLITATAKLNAAGKYEDYNQIFNSWREEGIVEFVTEEENTNCHYLPHRPVFKPTSLTTPVRPVFDASCKSGRNPSLNDCCEKGPNMLELIPSVLHRFRERNIGVVSDIRKAFQMIEVHENDRDFLRFLWWEDPEAKTMKIFRHCRVVFGVNCSPFLLAAVLEHHLNSVQDSRRPTAQKLLKALYVDNCVTSVDTVQEYDDFRSTSIEILAEAKMDLRQWEFTVGEETRVGSLNSSECGLGSGSSELPQELTSVLGYKWDKRKDVIKCDLPEKLGQLPEVLTKRIILSRVQQVFDPLGFLCPAMLPPKMILQSSWEENRTVSPQNSKGNNKALIWDTGLPDEMQKQFRDWNDEATILGSVEIPRCLQRNFLNEEVHVFADASKFAYAAAAFLRVETEVGVSVQLIQAKSRVAPLKKLSIPRLELMACTISARLLNCIREAIDIDKTPTFLWSDSTTALAWIRRNDTWGTFVGNRVKEIVKLTEVQCWRHVPGIENPADLPSRGCTAKELLQSKWWEGPQWLRKSSKDWPKEEFYVNEQMVEQEKKKATVKPKVKSTERPWYLIRYSRYSSNLRVFAWMLRFIGKMRQTNQDIGPLTPPELDYAELRMVRIVQAEAFPRKENSSELAGLKVDTTVDGVMCIRTKLKNRLDSQAFKTPLILPSEHPFVEQIIREVHIYNRHSGTQFLLGKLRERFWILRGRRTIKKMLSSCVLCRRYTTKAPTVPEAPLPKDRVKEAKTFQIVGVDLAGPLFLKSGNKAWIVLFTCAIYRAVHIEMVTSLSTDAFLLALHRFISRRGRPEKIYSDNGTNFVGANNLFIGLDWKKIEKDTRVCRIQWRFNPPSAAWWGGFWERIIRTIKDLLRKSLGHSKLNEAQLETCLCEVEAIINGRPLTYITEDAEDLVPLTPAMFLQDIQTCSFPEEECLLADDLNKRYRNLAQMKEELRSRFRTEYLALLVHRGKARKPEEFHVGDIVLVGSDNKKRHEWPLARIVELIAGKDGNVRVAKIKTETSELLRPLQRLFPLEVSQSIFLPKIPERKTKEMKKKKIDDQKTVLLKTRYGRTVKPTTFFES